MSGRKVGGLGVALLIAAGTLHWASISGSTRPGAAEIRAAAPAPAAVASETSVAAPLQPVPAVLPSIPRAAQHEPSQVERADRAAEVAPPEEIERRRAIAMRIRERIAAGPNAVAPPVVGGGVLAEGDPHPVYEENGQLRGVELQNVEPDGLYARLGLREGDVVQSVNGVEIADSGALLQEIVAADTLDVAVEHEDGTQGQVSWTIEQILDELKQLQ